MTLVFHCFPAWVYGHVYAELGLKRPLYDIASSLSLLLSSLRIAVIIIGAILPRSWPLSLRRCFGSVVTMVDRQELLDNLRAVDLIDYF